MTINKESTALVVIDLQKGIAGRETKPHSSKIVCSNAAKLADAFRMFNMPVFLVHVTSKPDERLTPESDEKLVLPSVLPKDWADFVPELGPEENDIIIGKKQWGAFYGTELELQLRRRKIDTIVLCGISTTYGVESTARFAYEFGFRQVFADDAMSAMNEESHNASVNYVFKRIGLVRKTAEILESLK